MLNVLVVGTGGRESEIGRQLAASHAVGTLFFISGNAGTARLPKSQNVTIDPTNLAAIVEFVKDTHIGAVIIGPEAPLIGGLGNLLRAANVPVLGTSSQAAQLEASKAFAADFMARHNIPQPEYHVARTLPEALAAIADKQPSTYVIKADGLTSGKGVVLPASTQEASATMQAMFSGQGFGGAGKKGVVIQQRLHGPEISAFAISDGHHFILLPFAQGKKRLQDGDQGPNTAGMGAYCPVPASIVTQGQADKIRAITAQTITGMEVAGTPYQGVLYMGIILAEEHGGDPVVIDYNARFGDPETQVMLPVLEQAGYSVGDMLMEIAKGNLGGTVPLPTSLPSVAVTICLAASGYPDKPHGGDVIEGLEKTYDNTIIHLAGAAQVGEETITSGGRVLYVTGLGATAAEAAAHAYAAIGPNAIHFAGMQYRTDIGQETPPA